MELLAATEGGLWVVEPEVERAERALDEPVRCVAAGGDGIVLAGTADGVRLSGDRGRSFERIELYEPDVFSVAVSPADGALYAGTEPSHVFRATALGEPFEELEALRRIPSRENWSFPPRPWTHHVRWIAPSPHDPERLLAGIELGGVMLSADGGQSFTDHRPGAVADAHQLAWHPTAAGRAYEVGGGGAAWSIDGGESWEQDAGGLEVTYCWTLAVSPSDPDLWWIAAAPGPMQAHRRGDAGAHLYRRVDGGWERLAGPLAEMPYALVATDAAIFLATRGGRLRVSEDGGESWIELGAELGLLSALAALP
jgi:hypothetical protein